MSYEYPQPTSDSSAVEHEGDVLPAADFDDLLHKTDDRDDELEAMAQDDADRAREEALGSYEAPVTERVKCGDCLQPSCPGCKY